MRPYLLVAEGDPKMRELYGGFLKKKCYEAAFAENGLDCLQWLRQVKPDVIVLDLELTWGGGDGVLDWLRHDRACSDIPVILTASAGHAIRPSDLVDWPVVEFLVKPISLNHLETILHAALAVKGRKPPMPERQPNQTDRYLRLWRRAQFHG